MSTATELLRRARNVFGNCRGDDAEDLFDEICAFLDAEPEAEPVAYLFDADSYCDHAPIKDELVQSLPKGMLRQKIKNVRPLYTKPEPARKPMTEEEIDRYLDNECLADFDARIFKWAISIAEKHHGIGGDK